MDFNTLPGVFMQIRASSIPGKRRLNRIVIELLSAEHTLGDLS